MIRPFCATLFLAVMSLPLAAACSSSTGGNVGSNDSGTITCMPGQICNCGSGSTCDVTCAGGGCAVNCGSDSICDVSCKGHGCHVVCGENATCNTCATDSSVTCGVGAMCPEDRC